MSKLVKAYSLLGREVYIYILDHGNLSLIIRFTIIIFKEAWNVSLFSGLDDLLTTRIILE